MTDTEKKIAEIREGYKSEPDDNFTYKKEIVEQDIRFLLSELDRRDEENRKLRKERDDAREQAQKYYRKFEDEVEETLRLQEERAKLIEGLRWYAQWNDVNTVSLMLSDKGQRARDILKEVGVTVE